MELKDFAAVSGKPGLWKIIKPARTGLILESYDDNKSKLVTGPNHRVSVLDEISIYTTEVDKTIPLKDLFQKIHDEFGADPGVDPKSDGEELRAFMTHIAPDHDPDRVYGSDIKKVVAWYLNLYPLMGELLEKKDDGEQAGTDEAEKEEKAEKKVKKAGKKGGGKTT